MSNGEYSNLLIVAAFSNKSFSSKNSYLPTFPDDKAEILAVFLNHIELCFAWFWYQLFWFFWWQLFYNEFFLNINALSDDKIVSFTKNENGSLVLSLERYTKSLNSIRQMIWCYLLEFSLFLAFLWKKNLLYLVLKFLAFWNKIVI